jgi:O-antigen/teichoic acid export membrane protein
MGIVRETIQAGDSMKVLRALAATLHNRWGNNLGAARRRGFANAVYGVADYIAQPIAMLLAAPFLLHRLGLAQYGIWILSSAAVSSGGLVSSGFGDASIKYIAECRGRNDLQRARQIVGSMMTINLALSSIFAIILWAAAPYVARHTVRVDLGLQTECLRSLRIGCLLLVAKSTESVIISTLRAFETYGPTVRISIYSRALIVISAVTLAWANRDVVWIMLATLVITVGSIMVQGICLRSKIGDFSLVPSWHKETVSTIAAFGSFSWLQAAASVAFSQVDRLLIGLFLGTPAVAYYGLCVQAAQPIHGLVASGMHFLFPHLSVRQARTPVTELKHTVVAALRINAVLVAALSLPLLIFSKRILTIWIGSAFAHQAWVTLPIIAFGFALVGMNVTAHYTLLAIGEVRIVTYLNLLAGGLMLLAMIIAIPKWGVQGAAVARLIFGPITCLMYYRLYKIMWRPVLGAPSSILLTATNADTELPVCR